ncbi:MAG: flagellar filament capping protein FliD [Salinisphaeraceae bacterium]
MAGISSMGIGSGLDINGIVQQLVAAERSPVEQRLTRQKSDIDAQISALGTFKAVASGLDDVLAGLVDGDAFGARLATSANDEILSVSAADGTAPGGYQVEVLALASTQKLASGGFADGGAVVGTGSLTIAAGTTDFTVTIDGTSASLAGIRDAINNAVDNPGVRASVIQGDDGAHLVLTAAGAGTGNTMTVTASGGDGGLAVLTYPPGAGSDMSEISAAADAQVRVDGILHTASDNSIDGALDGVTLSLSKAAPGELIDVAVRADDQAVVEAVAALVNRYNTFNAAISTVTRADPGGDRSGALVGDAMLRGAAQSMRRILGDTRVDGIGTLADLGITTALNGTLSLDKAALGSALKSDPDAVRAALTGSAGMAGAMSAGLQRYLGSDGLIEGRNEGLSGRLEDIADRSRDLDRRMQSLNARLTAQFTALDSLVAQMQSTGNFLTQQLAGLPGVNRGDS